MISDLCTVIIPVFNRKDELREAIWSVLGQTYPHIEIIVVDDGSNPPLDPDQYQQACAKRGIPTRWIALPVNLGPSNARNKGLEAARGEFITFLDSDDVMLPRRLEEQIGVLQQDANASAAMCGYTTSLGSSAMDREDNSHLPKGDISLERLLSFDRSLSVTGPGAMYRAACVRAVNGFDPLLHAVEDFDLLVRIVANGGTIRPLRKVLVRVDVSPKRRHLSEDLKKQEIGRLRFLKKHDALLACVPRARIENLLCLGIVRFRAGKRLLAISDFLRVIWVKPFRLKAWAYLFFCVAPSLYPLVKRAAKAAHGRA